MNTMTLPELTQEYILTHDLRPDTVKIYWAATKSYVRFFGDRLASETTHRDMLDWRRSELERISKRSWNTYSGHLRTVYRYAMEHGLVDLKVNPLKETRVIPAKRPKKTVNTDAIVRARNWLNILVQEERATGNRTEITPAWFWLAVFEMFYYTGIRLNALICLRYADIDLGQRLIRVRGETEKTHREFMIPIPDGLMPHLELLMDIAHRVGFDPADQIFNVNRFSGHYSRPQMNADQVEAMYKKLTAMTDVRMTPHRFRHTIASEMMRQPERNIHITKNLLNHSNIATTMEYIEPDYDVMREVMNERSRRPAKINYLPKPDAANRESARTSKKAPAKHLTQRSVSSSPAVNSGSLSQPTLPPAPAANAHSPLKADEIRRAGVQVKNTESNLSEKYGTDPEERTNPFDDSTETPMRQALPHDLFSSEDLARQLEAFSQWVREAASGRIVACPRTTDSRLPSGPNEQMGNPLPSGFDASVWNNRTG
ncbi:MULTISPECIES: site-specific integrase [Pseudomonas syringae group]|uniref:site-specific integrase n=1 Tax=Pseudomonas syringae group TaxID=136849 RepID=UPI00076028C2|nr:MULTISPECIES: site-specific integrase [Pseudomonas syringae group]KWS67107.1 integrase [Pseudomonas amygdali pv. morsprunorum]POP95410.1 integrase [Pseudomonas amygdali pv. morsprunorum]SPD80380.1 putative tyrosine recombinase XerC [Pseudomonas syringae]SPD81192.1 putative tyrosine recombinase XerC [Pseudomonas syringae]